MTQRITRHISMAWLIAAGCALASGLLLACAFPPIGWTGAVWVGLVPLLWAIRRSPSPGRAYALGSLAGFLFFLITIHPLTSASSWSGWLIETPDAFAARITYQWWWLHGVWIAFALFGTIFWGAWAALTHGFGSAPPWRRLLATVGAWILIPEWLRAQTTFGCTWAFLGNALVQMRLLRQWAAVGGVEFLSALVVLANAAIASALFDRGRRWQPLAMTAGVLACAWGGGALLCAHTTLLSARGTPLHAAAIQYEKRGEYAPPDYTPLGVDRGYIPLIQQTFTRPVDVLVLPESIVLGTVSLDESTSRVKPPDYQMPVALWDDEMRALLSGRSTTLVVGMDTVEEGEDYNTLVAWTADGRAGAYHKRQLVPFSEYQPSGWSALAPRGRSSYAAGRGSQLIMANGMRLGGLICQEVVFPSLARESVRGGATLLVSGGQDGVFTNPAVSTIEAQMAQLRAVETGRFFVRANKEGVSAIIDPSGKEIARSPAYEPAVLRAVVRSQTGMTSYVRFGDWVVWLAAVLVLAAGLPVWLAVRARRRSAAPPGASPSPQYPWVVAWSLGLTGLMVLGLSRAGRLDLMSVWMLRDFLGYGHFALAYLFTWQLVRRQLVTRTTAVGYLALFLGVIALYACVQRWWLTPAMDILFIMTLFMTHHASNELLFRQQTRNGYHAFAWTARRTLWVALAVWLVLVDQLGHPLHVWHAAQPTAVGLWAAGWLVYGWIYALRAPRRPSALWGWVAAGGLGAWCAFHPTGRLVFTSLFRFGWIIIYHYVAWYVFYTYKLIHRNGGWRMTAPAPRSATAAWTLATTTPQGFLLLVLVGNLAILGVFLATLPLAHHLAARTGLNFFHLNTVAHIVFGAGLPRTIAARSAAASREIPEPLSQFGGVPISP